MLNKLAAFLRAYDMISPGDHVVCAVSGGADSTALLFAFYLLKEKLGISLSAAHFNHRLRGAESDADEAFVRAFCGRYDIPLSVGSAEITAGKKGLEAAAREARYRFLRSLPGKIATAHTADDNAETVLMHMLRGTGLKGLGGIRPVNGSIIRPMLTCTRQDVEAFLTEYCLRHIEDSSNAGDAFLRNRIRHRVMPLMAQENPSFSAAASRMALRLRQDEAFISGLMEPGMPTVPALRAMHPSLRLRYLERFLKENGVPEPEQSHLAAAENLVFTEKPSASANFPGGVLIGRNYDRLERRHSPGLLPEIRLQMGENLCPEWGIRVTCTVAENLQNSADCFTVQPEGSVILRSRREGDSLRLPGGTKSLKKLMIDRKIPAAERPAMPVLADDRGILAVGGIGVHENRRAEALPALRITIQKDNGSDWNG